MIYEKPPILPFDFMAVKSEIFEIGNRNLAT